MVIKVIAGGFKLQVRNLKLFTLLGNLIQNGFIVNLAIIEHDRSVEDFVRQRAD